MLGRPLRMEPEFMKACAGSWLICSVTIERMTQMSSAMEPMCGNSSEISVPDCPHFLNFENEPRAISLLPWSWASCWPAVKDSGNGWPLSASSWGFGSNDSRWDGPPAMQRCTMRFALAGKCRPPWL